VTTLSTEDSIPNYTRNVLKKLQLSRKQELMRYALEHGVE
jgi:DNA-binding NarL/FixJ family response regulator